MPSLHFETTLQAPAQICFDLARDIDFHTQAFAHTGEKAVAGITQGLIGMDETVTWEARHFGIRQRLTVKITQFKQPHYFQDVMTQGAFKAFKHDHYFEAIDDQQTLMRDIITFESPGWIIGTIFDQLFLKHYLRRLIQERCDALQTEASRRTGKPA